MDTADDPVLSPAECCEDAGIGITTWKRVYRHKLPIIRITPKRIGVRRSDWRKALEQRTEVPA